MRERAGLAVLTICLVLALSAFAWRGAYTRYFSDDFCSASVLHKLGFAETMRTQRAEWSGRFSFFAVKAPLEWIGPVTARFTPGVIVVAMILAAAFFVRSLPIVAQVPVALILAFAAIDSAPDKFDRYGPFAWETGALTYMLPTVLFLVWLGLVARGRGAWWGALVLLVAGGLSETSLVAQCAMTAGVTLVALVHRDRQRTRVAVAGLAATLLALAIVVSAPGNATRAAGLPPRPSVVEAGLRAAEIAYTFVGSHLFVEGASLLLVGAAGLVVGQRIGRRVALAAMFIAVAAYLSAFVPAVWTLSAAPPPRALYVASFFAMLAVFAGFAALSRAGALRAALVALFALSIVPLWSAVSTIRALPEARREARNVDAILRLVEPQRGQDLLIRSRWAMESRWLGPDITDPNTACMSRYYDLRSIRVTK
jgi:hypothetical protein